MFWLCLVALYLLGAPVTMFLLAVCDLMGQAELERADTQDVVLYVLLWPAILIFFLIVVAVWAGEAVRRKWWEL